MAVIATIATLTALLLPVLGKAKAKAMQASCGSNMRQLGLAWTMYANDNGGRLPESYAPDNPYVWVKGDMTKEEEATDEQLIKQGKLYPYNSNTSIYRCPTDRGVLIDNHRVRNVRSYSMNAFMGGREATANRPIPDEAANFVWFFAKDSDVPRPSELFVLVDEDERSINDGAFVTDPNARMWFDFPTIASYRHGYSYTLNYADGHAQAWQLRDPRTRLVNYNRFEMADNADLKRLAKSATVPK